MTLPTSCLLLPQLQSFLALFHLHIVLLVHPFLPRNYVPYNLVVSTILLSLLVCTAIHIYTHPKLYTIYV